MMRRRVFENSCGYIKSVRGNQLVKKTTFDALGLNCNRMGLNFKDQWAYLGQRNKNRNFHNDFSKLFTKEEKESSKEEEKVKEEKVKEEKVKEEKEPIEEYEYEEKYSESEEPSAKQRMKRILNPVNILLAVGLSGALVYFQLESYRSKLLREAQVQTTQVVTAPNSSRPLLGGAFTLVDTNGKPVTDSVFRGKWMFVYFGFCNCPDICPEEMRKMTKAINKMDPSSQDKVLPIFISVDPFRDSLTEIKEYLKDFHPRFYGLTGTPEQIKIAAKKYRVYYSQPDYEQDPDDYLVDHSVFIYLMDPNGYLSDYYGTNIPADQIAARVSNKVKEYEIKKSKRQMQSNSK